jgi:hypothetical protein
MVRPMVAWQQSLSPPEHESKEDRELRKNLKPVYEYWERKVKAEGKAEGKVEGKVEGKAEALLLVLAGRGLTVTAAQRKQMLACTDAAQLDAWLRAAGTTSSVKALLSGGALPPHRQKQSRPAAPPR